MWSTRVRIYYLSSCRGWMSQLISFYDYDNHYYLIFIFTVQALFPSSSTHWLFHILNLPPTPVSKRMTTHYHRRPPHTLGFQVCQEIVTSSLTESRPGSPLLNIGGGPPTSWLMLPSWWLSVWDFPEIKVSWDCWFSYGITLCHSFFQLFPNSITGITSFCRLVGCNYLHLTQLLGGPFRRHSG